MNATASTPAPGDRPGARGNAGQHRDGHRRAAKAAEASGCGAIAGPARSRRSRSSAATRRWRRRRSTASVESPSRTTTPTPGRGELARVLRGSQLGDGHRHRLPRPAIVAEPGAIAVAVADIGERRGTTASPSTLARPACDASVATRDRSALAYSRPDEPRAQLTGDRLGVRAGHVALGLVEAPAAAVSTPLARASALPCSLSLISLSTRKPTAIIGTTTIRTKKVVRRVRKLMPMPGPGQRIGRSCWKRRRLPAGPCERCRGLESLRHRAVSTAARGYSSVGRAPGSHPGGRGFESP